MGSARRGSNPLAVDVCSRLPRASAFSQFRSLWNSRSPDSEPGALLMSVKIYSQALGQLSYGRQAYTCSNQLSLVFAFWLLFWPQVICDCARPPEGLLARILAKTAAKLSKHLSSAAVSRTRCCAPFGAVFLSLCFVPPPFVAVYLDFRSPMGTKEGQLRQKAGERARSETQKWLWRLSGAA